MAEQREIHLRTDIYFDIYLFKITLKGPLGFTTDLSFS